ncbi:MAG: 3-dehydroquinate synthase [Brevinematales bacterium]|nr:3-dehydroquinate synthase [Brevinematales bacterium]
MREISLKVKVPSSRNAYYPIVFGNNHWKQTLASFVENHTFSKVIFLVDEQVFSFWKEEIEQFPHPEICILPSGETSKNLEKAMEIIGFLTRQGCDRKSLLVTLGGGVVGDLGGFVASLYMRGIAFVQIPTTVLSLVDSSIGGKTGVDTSYGKNLVGSFHFPSLVIADVMFLQSLPETQKKNGYVEMVKHALIADEGYYRQLMVPFTEKEWPSLLWKSCQIKARIVEKDPREHHLRQILNFGHTLGHAIEHAAGYEILHGFAVAWGMIGEAFLSVKQGILRQDILHTLIQDFKKNSLLFSPQTILKLSWEDVRYPLLHDKKNIRNHIHVVLLEKIGQVKHTSCQYSYPLPEELFQEAFVFLKNIAEEWDESH